MAPIKIALVSMGVLKYPLDLRALESWSSVVLDIRHGAAVGQLSNTDGPNWEYSDEHLLELLKPHDGAEITLGLINAQLENNYYLRRLSDRVAVLSIYEMADIVGHFGFTLEQYVLRTAYELAVLARANGKLLSTDNDTWAHDETRGCIFDMNANKTDIVFSLHQPVLCQACRQRVLTRQVPANFLPSVEKELRQIRKALYYRMQDWIRQHPLLALLITALSAVTLNLVANIVFEFLRPVLPWLQPLP